jgi:hypothetical protein
MAFENIAKPLARGTLPNEEDKKNKIFSGGDTLMAIPRGVEGFAQSLYDLADYAAADTLPNWDKRFLGKSETMVGGFVEGTTQFLTGFIPVAGQLGKLSKANKALNAFSKARPVTSQVTKAATAGAVSDFVSFQAQEERLSNLLNEFPQLANPVTEYLAADKDDGEIEGRFKNVIEGLFLEAGMVGIGTAFTQTVKAIKKGKKGNITSEDLQDIVTFNNKMSSEEKYRDFEYGTEPLRKFAEEKYGAEYEGKDLRLLDVLHDYGNFSPETPEGQLAKKLTENFQEQLGNTRVNFNADRTARTTYGMALNEGAGLFEGRVNMGIGGEKALLHESVHAITQAGLSKYVGHAPEITGKEYGKLLDNFLASDANDAQAQAIKGLATSYKKTIDALGLKKNVNKVQITKDKPLEDYDYERLPYGLANLSEFVAEAFTNTEFQRTLRQIEGSTKGTSLFDDVKEFVKHMLGIGGKEASLLDDVFNQVADLGTANDNYVRNLLSLEADASKFSARLGTEEARFEASEGKRQGLNRGLFDEFEAENNNFDDALGDTLDLDQGYTDRPMIGNVDGFQGRGFLPKDYPLQGAGIDTRGTEFGRYPRPAPVPYTHKDFITMSGPPEVAARKIDGEDQIRVNVNIDDLPSKRLEQLVNGEAKDITGNPIELNQREMNNARNELRLRELEVDGEGRNVGRVDSEPNLDAKEREADAVLADKEKNSFRPKGLVYTNGVVNAKKMEADGKGIAAVTKAGTTKHYGNPFSHLKSFQGKGIVPTKNLEESNTNYEKWLKGTDFKDVAQEQRKWTLEQIDAGKLDDVDLIYYSRQRSKTGTKFNLRVDKKLDPDTAKGADLPDQKEVFLPRNNHAAILRNFINERRSLKGEAPKTQTKGIVSEKAKESIYNQTDLAFSKENADAVIDALNRGQLKTDDPNLVGMPIDKREQLVDWGSLLAFRNGLTETPSYTLPNYKGMSKKASTRFRSLQNRLKEIESGKIEDINIDRRTQSISKRLDEERKAALGASEEGRKDPRNDETLENDILESLRELTAVVAKDLETGGPQSVRSAANKINSSAGATLLIQAMAENIIKRGEYKTVSKEELIKEVGDVIQMANSGNEIDFRNTIDKIERQGISLEEYRGQVAATKELIDILSVQAVDIAKTLDEARQNPEINRDIKEAELLDTLDKLYEIQRIWSLQGKETGLTLVQRKFLKGAEGQRQNQRVGFDFENIKDQSARETFKDSKLGGMRIDEIVDLLKQAQNQDQVKQAIQCGKICKSMRGGSMMRMINEYWINSLLSGPTTQIVNVMGNTLTGILRQVELGIGGLIISDPKMTRAALQFGFQTEAFADSLSIMARSFKDDVAVLTQGSGVFADGGKNTQIDNIKAITSDGGDAFGDAINVLGKAIRMPSRGLQAGDEFFKQMNYRVYIRTQLAYEAMTELKLKDGKEIAEYVNKKFNDYITEGDRAYNEHNLYLDALSKAKELNIKDYSLDQQSVIAANKKKFDPRRGRLADKALQYANESTFTNELDGDGVVDLISRGISKFKEKYSAFNFIVPFIRTPTNILKFALQRTGSGAAFDYVFRNKKFMEKFKSNDPRVKAEFHGQLATAAASSTAFVMYLQSNAEIITGHGPDDKARNEIWRQSGKRPYSIKMGNTWVSYQKLDPFATVIGLIADLVHGGDYNDFNEGEAERVLATISLAFINNVTNKSYVKGLDSLVQALRDPVANIGKIGQNVAGGFVPTLFSQSMNMGDERILREARSMLDAMIKKVPVAEGTLPAKRNFLGEAVTVENKVGGFGIMNPFYMSEESDDVVDKEISRLAHGFNLVTPKLHGAIDLREHEEGGRQAYDRLLEIQSEAKINDMSQRQALRKLMNSKYYKGLPEESDDDIGMKSPRVNAINKIIKRYRKFSRNQLLKEFPELQAQYDQMSAERLQYRTTL